MDRGERERMAEEWLDAALRQYAEAEPRPGLEGRILANLAAAEAERKSGWLWLPVSRLLFPVSVAVAVIAVVFAIAVWRGGRKPEAVVNTQQAEAAHSDKVPTLAPKLGARVGHPDIAKASPQRTRRTQGIRRGEAIAESQPPRLEQFPAPTPLSEQEQLLLRYMQQTPKAEVGAVIAANHKFEEERLRELEDSSSRAH